MSKAEDLESRKYLIRTFGCQMNEHDSDRIGGMLEADGMSRADSESDADLIVFNTCCVRENADNRLYGNLGALKALKASRPNLRIAVAGCLAQKDGATIVEKAPHVDVVFGTNNIGMATELLARREAAATPVVEILDASDAAASFASDLPARLESSTSGLVTIATGCNNSCTFCVVPAVRGPEISRRPGEIADEVRRMAADGVVEVLLLGQNVNSYGRDLGLDGHRPVFAELLRTIDSIEGIRRIRFTSPHPKDLRPETMTAMADCDSVMPQLHLPVQSGSDRILSAMHRGYTAARYLEKLADARAAITDLAVSTDIIVGFPGETESDFEETIDLVRAAHFDSAFTFIYSPRDGTPAAAIEDSTPRELVTERYQRLSTLVNAISYEANQARVGLVEEVLVTGQSKRNAARLSGRTPQNRIVHFAPVAMVKPGGFASVKISEAAPHHLIGEIVTGAVSTSRPVPVTLQTSVDIE